MCNTNTIINIYYTLYRYIIWVPKCRNGRRKKHIGCGAVRVTQVKIMLILLYSVRIYDCDVSGSETSHYSIVIKLTVVLGVIKHNITNRFCWFFFFIFVLFYCTLPQELGVNLFIIFIILIYTHRYITTDTWRLHHLHCSRRRRCRRLRDSYWRGDAATDCGVPLYINIYLYII